MLPPLVTQSLPTGLCSRRSISGSAARVCAEPQTTILTANTAGSSCRPPRRMAFPLSFSLFDDDLPVHPRMRRADVVVAAGLGEGDGLRLALLQHAGIPVALLKRRRRVLDVTDIGEGDCGAGLHPNAGRSVGILDIVRTDIDRVDPLGDRSGRPGQGLWRRWRPQRANLP